MKAIALLAIVSLAGCIPKADAESTSPPSTAACNADGLQKHVGKTLTAELQKQMQKEAGAAVVRTAHKDGMITMDYNAGRLNIFYDDQNVIARINCG